MVKMNSAEIHNAYLRYNMALENMKDVAIDYINFIREHIAEDVDGFLCEPCREYCAVEYGTNSMFYDEVHYLSMANIKREMFDLLNGYFFIDHGEKFFIPWKAVEDFKAACNEWLSKYKEHLKEVKSLENNAFSKIDEELAEIELQMKKLKERKKALNKQKKIAE